MPEVEEYRIKIEAIQERLKTSNGEGEDEVQDLKDRLGSVRDAMQRKQQLLTMRRCKMCHSRCINAPFSI